MRKITLLLCLAGALAVSAQAGAARSPHLIRMHPIREYKLPAVSPRPVS
jgi:hypothetical protein